MAFCNDSVTAAIAAGLNLLTVVYPNTSTPFTVTTSVNNLFLIESPTAQTITFNVQIVSEIKNTTFTLYRIFPDNSFQNMGGASVTTANSSFTFELLIGTYVVCVRPGGAAAQSGSFVGQFIGYPITQNLQPKAYTGQSLITSLSVLRPPVECDEPIYFELIDGELPPGLVMDPIGNIAGVLPNLDCLPDAPSPAIGWYYEENEMMLPISRQWRFKVRIGVDGMAEELKKENWFCIRIHNNWDFDRDNFIDNFPFETTESTRVTEPVQKLKGLCPPCEVPKVAKRFVPVPIQQQCVACEPPKKLRIEILELPESMCGCPVDELIVWYINRPETDSPSVLAFRKKLEDSYAFQRLLSKAGYVPDENPDEFAIVNTFDNSIQITLQSDIDVADPESVAGMVNFWRSIQNQSLPIDTIAVTGENSSVAFV